MTDWPLGNKLPLLVSDTPSPAQCQKCAVTLEEWDVPEISTWPTPRATTLCKNTGIICFIYFILFFPLVPNRYHGEKKRGGPFRKVECLLEWTFPFREDRFRSIMCRLATWQKIYIIANVLHTLGDLEIFHNLLGGHIIYP